MSLSEEINALAPEQLCNYRKKRYHGGDQCLSLSAFTTSDQAIVRDLYEFLQTLFALLSAHGGSSAPAADGQLGRAETFLAGLDVDALVSQVRAFGPASIAANPTPHMAETIHDLRGGGLAPLLGQLQLAELCSLGESEMRSLSFLTRDHLKIMRNALLGLDDAQREKDHTRKLHSIDFIVENWQRAVLHGELGKETRLEIHCEFRGNISECCVEFGALDRVLYNLINNACQHSAAKAIQLVILPVPRVGTKDVRFALLNRISAEDEKRLAGQPLRELFRPGVSSTGSGLGMSVAAEFVTNAYGLTGRESALDGCYLGAKLLDDRRFAAWFHWPIAPDV